MNKEQQFAMMATGLSSLGKGLTNMFASIGPVKGNTKPKEHQSFNSNNEEVL